MRKALSLIAMISLSLANIQAAKLPKKFSVSIQNLTKGQPLTPPVIAVHSPKVAFFKIGESASEGLAILSQDGVTDTFVQELASIKTVVRSQVGTGVIMPGKSQELVIEANDPRFVLSVVSMLARTNDAIMAAQKLPLKLKKGMSFSVLASVYDAGAEMNTESCSTIPAPPCANPMVGTNGGEGFIRPHEGVQGTGDLDLSRDSFAQKVAKITIKRIQ